MTEGAKVGLILLILLATAYAVSYEFTQPVVDSQTATQLNWLVYASVVGDGNCTFTNLPSFRVGIPSLKNIVGADIPFSNDQTSLSWQCVQGTYKLRYSTPTAGEPTSNTPQGCDPKIILDVSDTGLPQSQSGVVYGKIHNGVNCSVDTQLSVSSTCGKVMAYPTFIPSLTNSLRYFSLYVTPVRKCSITVYASTSAGSFDKTIAVFALDSSATSEYMTCGDGICSLKSEDASSCPNDCPKDITYPQSKGSTSTLVNEAQGATDPTNTTTKSTSDRTMDIIVIGGGVFIVLIVLYIALNSTRMPFSVKKAPSRSAKKGSGHIIRRTIRRYG